MLPARRERVIPTSHAPVNHVASGRPAMSLAARELVHSTVLASVAMASKQQLQQNHRAKQGTHKQGVLQDLSLNLEPSGAGAAADVDAGHGSSKDAGGVRGAADAMGDPAASMLDQTPFAFATRIAAVLEDDDAVEGADFEDLQQVLQKVIKTKSAKAQHRQQLLLQDLQGKLETQAKALEAAVAKDAKDATTFCTTSFDGMLRRLADKHAQLEALNKRFQQDLHQLWEEYNDIYNALEGTKTEVKAIAAKKRSALKRKITQAQAQCSEQLQETERKVAKLKSQSAKLPGLTNVLKAFM